MTTLNPQASSQLECTVSDNGNVSCTATSDCDMELRVMCLEQDFVTRLAIAIVNQKDTTNCETMSTSTKVSDNSSGQNCGIASGTTSEVEQPSNNEMLGSCPIAFLGGVIGLLVVVLLGLAIGLTVTCCVFGKRRSQKQQAE